jgi:hypothetical protein
VGFELLWINEAEIIQVLGWLLIEAVKKGETESIDVCPSFSERAAPVRCSFASGWVG